ncbi:MAG: hypothetical protein LBP59_13360 [Planctomycetaceae bacterium]|nr:hypothetical protein [Planctomycetaceae bacterium]
MYHLFYQHVVPNGTDRINWKDPRRLAYRRLYSTAVERDLARNRFFL